MNILVFGAGAIGSLFGGLLSKNNNVAFIGRKPHVNVVSKNGLRVGGKTKFSAKIPCFTDIDNISFTPDLVILTVKSYDTEIAINQVKSLISKDTYILSLQNGLDNVEKISKIVNKDRILAGVTSHGVTFLKPGIVRHTGVGYTTIGALTLKGQRIANDVVSVFNNAGVKTSLNEDIVGEIWTKVIINSSINPITSFFNCKNGYLNENPVVENLVKSVCNESTLIANEDGLDFSFEDMFEKTKGVIRDTADNYSSMVQSVKKGCKTEVDSINGRLVEIGTKNGADISLNEILVYLVKSLV